MEGFNSTIFAYGQSVSVTQGSGKTFSMLGPEEVTEVLVNQAEVIPPEVQELYGIIPRATFHMFDMINQGIANSTQYIIKCSYIEIYNENINDLLCSPPAENLRMREFPNLGMCVIGMTEKFISTPEEVFECLSLGTANRITCATGQNARSSRSHTVFILVVEQKFLDGTSKVSKLNLVDLAGSEKLSKTGAAGQALKEAQNINLSLTTLGRCINALTAKKPEHVPYRESKLTMILKESLGGNSKTSLICTTSQKNAHKEESITTLKFAERAKLVQNKAKSNTTESPEQMRIMVEQLKAEVAQLRRQLEGGDQPPAEDLGPFSGSDFKFLYEEMQAKFTSLQVNSEMGMEELRRQLEQAELKNSQSVDALTMHEEVLEYKEQIAEANKLLATSREQGSTERLQSQELLRQKQLLIEQSEHQFELAKTEIASLKQQSDVAKRDLDSKDGIISELETRVSAAEAQIESLNKTCAELGRSLDAKSKALLTAEQAYSDSNQNYSELESAMRSLQLQFRTAEETLSALQIDHKELLAQTSEVKNLNIEYKAQISVQSQALERFQIQLKGLVSVEEANVLEQQRNDEMSRKLTEVEARLSAALQELELEKAKNNELNKTQKLSESSNQRLQAQITALNTRISAKDRQLDDCKSEISSFTAQLEAMRTSLIEEQLNSKSVVSAKDQLISALKKTGADSEAKSLQELFNLQTTNTSLAAEIECLKKTVAQRDSVIAGQNKTYHSLEETRARLETKVTKLELSLKAKAKESKYPEALVRKATRGSVISSAVKVNTAMFGGVTLKKTGNKFLKEAMVEAERARAQAPKSEFKVFYGAADIKALYSSEVAEESSDDSSSSSSSDEDVPEESKQ